MDSRKDRETHDVGERVAWTVLTLAVIVLLAMLLILCGSCTRKIYVPVERAELRTDTLYCTLWNTDTVIDRDTVLTLVKGDTVTIDRIRWRVRVKERHDTVYRTKTDSVYVEKPYPVEVVKEVEKPLAWWQKALMSLGGMLAVCVLLVMGKWAYTKFR